jgi:hypothetical protein
LHYTSARLFALLTVKHNVFARKVVPLSPRNENNMKKVILSNHSYAPNLIDMTSFRFVKTLLLSTIIFATLAACEKDNSDNLETPTNPSGEVSPTEDVVTGDAVNLSYTSATVYGYVNMDNVTSMGIVYGTDNEVSKLVTTGTIITALSFEPGTNNRRFSVQLTDLEPNTTYYYYAFAGIKTANRILSFTTLGELEICPNSQHPHMIDLGLSSGTKWACCNVGASSPEQYGDYYAWGEKETKKVYDPHTYQHWDAYGHPIIVGSNIAKTQYDVASEEWGALWCMPTSEQCKELINETTSKWTSRYGVNGRIFIGKNGNTIFLPATGQRIQDGAFYAETYGYYWSSTNVNSYNANVFSFNSFGATCQSSGCCNGCSIRPVNSK